MCMVKAPKLPDPPPERALDRSPDRANAQQRASERVGYQPRGSLTAPGVSRKRAPTAILGATSTSTTPGVVLGG